MEPEAHQTPLGGCLVDRVLRDDARASALERARSLPALMVDREAEISFEMIATGVFSPLTGPLGKADTDSVLEQGRLADGTPWPVPFSFSPAGRRNEEVLRGLQPGDQVTLVGLDGRPVALLSIREKYRLDKEKRARLLFGTTDPSRHPGVNLIHRRMGDTSLAGEIELIDRPGWGAFERYRMTPAETRDLFYRHHDFQRVAGFVTGANPPHVGHEYMHRVALEIADAVLLLPQVEMERPDYVKATHRVSALEALADVYYPSFRVFLTALRTNYLFAGPREAILHALIMRNYGCTHALIGRDHAGVGDFFDMYASQRIFDSYTQEELGIRPLFFSEIFYCTRCRLPATEKTCPHDTRYRLQISGTGIREVLRRGYFPPKEICRPEVSHIAIQGIVPKQGPAEGGGIYPPGQTIHSLFPFYVPAARLGGHLRPHRVLAEDLGERDLQAALLDARTHADNVYHGVFVEIAAAAETNRTLGTRWRSEAREILRDHQSDLVDALTDKVEGMRQGKEDIYKERLDLAEKDLADARDVLDRHPCPMRPPEPHHGLEDVHTAAPDELVEP